MAGPSSTKVLLTETVKKGGCAAKLPAGELKSVLAALSLRMPSELSVGTENLDDAALWDLGDGRYLVQTLDFFTPIVDDPFDFGAVAAANALSDIYAMGGEPRIALTILAFPTQTLGTEILLPLMKGAVAKIEEAGACLAGGHSIDDETLKLGFSVSGFVAKDRSWKNTQARPGDRLILTKALGTGTISSAIKSKQAEAKWITEAIKSMTLLNRAPELLEEINVHSATDVTGFGLAGHSVQMARASGVAFEIEARQLPTLPGAMECLDRNVLNRAHRTNADYVRDVVSYEPDLTEAVRWLTVDPQTSGGLLLAIPSDEAQLALNLLKARFPETKIVGAVKEREPGGALVRFTL